MRYRGGVWRQVLAQRRGGRLRSPSFAEVLYTMVQNALLPLSRGAADIYIYIYIYIYPIACGLPATVPCRGSPWTPFWSPWAPPGPLLGCPGPLLGPPWLALDPFWVPLGLLLGPPGLPWAPPWPPLEPIGAQDEKRDEKGKSWPPFWFLFGSPGTPEK